VMVGDGWREGKRSEKEEKRGRRMGFADSQMSWGARLDGGWRVPASPPTEARSCAWIELGVGRRKKAEGGMGAG
jgi:hypothetical protein